MSRTRTTLLAALALCSLAATACSDSKTAGTTTTPPATAAPTTGAPATDAPTTLPPTTGTVVVFAASSLTAAFGEVGKAFTAANPDATVTFNFAGSSDLVTQLTAGAPADVFASADDSNMKKITDASLNAGAPVAIAKNTFAILVEKGNPKGITGVTDLAKSGLVVVLCAATVPCGKGAAQILTKAAVTVTPKSLETSVKGVVTKVTSGEADAGIVFVTDVLAAGAAAQGVDIPADVNVISNYPIVVTKDAKNPAAAKAFIAFVSSAAGQAILAKYGFLAP